MIYRLDQCDIKRPYNYHQQLEFMLNFMLSHAVWLKKRMKLDAKNRINFTITFVLNLQVTEKKRLLPVILSIKLHATQDCLVFLWFIDHIDVYFYAPKGSLFIIIPFLSNVQFGMHEKTQTSKLHPGTDHSLSQRSSFFTSEKASTSLETGGVSLAALYQTVDENP